MKTFIKVARIFFALILAFTGSMIVGSFFGPIAAALAVIGFLLLPYVVKLPAGVSYLTVGTAPGGVGTPFAFNMTYLPQFLIFDNTVPLTSLRIETAEDGVLHDWTAAGLVAMSNFMVVGAITANQLIMRIADGHIAGKNVTVTGITSAAGAIAFRANSERRGRLAFISKNAQILANQPTEFSDFTALWVPTMAAGTDRADIEYSTGHVQTYEMQELRELSIGFQQTPAVCVNNTPAYMRKATFVCTAQRAAYILSVQV